MIQAGKAVLIMAKDEFHGRVGIVYGKCIVQDNDGGDEETMYDVFMGSVGVLSFKGSEVLVL